MYDIQLSERNIVIEKSKHIGLIGVCTTKLQFHKCTESSDFRQSFIHSFNHIRLIKKKSEIQHKTSSMIKWKSLPSYDRTVKQILSVNSVF